jgi:aryl-alcohol dehydrogenase-like predicted oxidoreductase
MSPAANVERRPLGSNGPRIAPVALGCWPIAGVTTLDTNEADSLATIRSCLEVGVNHLDTAYVYGPQGESETLIRRAIEGQRDKFVIATKCGIHMEGKEFVNDGRPDTLKRECDESLRRLGVDFVEILYLHGPDPNVPVEESAGALRDLQAAGKTRAIGASNCTLEQTRAMHAVCPLAAVQLPYNMLQRDIERRTIPWCREQGIAVMVYWPLMKGLLTGRIGRNYQWDERDPRRNWPMYQGEEWQKNQDFLDRLRDAAKLTGHTVAQLVVNWTIHQPGITAALCGAKRTWQIAETAGAMGWQITPEQQSIIERALVERGAAAAKRAFE